MSTPTHWRDYKRHLISARYPDIKGQAWEDYSANVKKRGIRGRTITLYENQVLDGWQLYRACLEHDIEPRFTVLREGEDPEAYVEEANEHRRHESAEIMCNRRHARNERILAKTAQGKSTRAIAEEENVSRRTVDRVQKDGGGGAPAPPEQKPAQIIGRDGKQYDRTTPILCQRCSRMQIPVKDCPQCIEARKLKPRSGPTKRAGHHRSPPSKNGQPKRNWLREFESYIGPMAEVLNDLAKHRGQTRMIAGKPAIVGDEAYLKIKSLIDEVIKETRKWIELEKVDMWK